MPCPGTCQPQRAPFNQRTTWPSWQTSLGLASIDNSTQTGSLLKLLSLLGTLADRPKKKLLVVTGAGVRYVPAIFAHDEEGALNFSGAFRSTDSGLIDYRSPNGAYSKGYKPITFMEFTRQLGFRQRYWARSMVAWKNFSRYRPNHAHNALAALEEMGIAHHLVTQVPPIIVSWVIFRWTQYEWGLWFFFVLFFAPAEC